MDNSATHSGLKFKLHELIFEADTPSGRFFDLVLIWCIVLSVLAVMLDSIQVLSDRYSTLFYVVEWVFTIIFTIEYVLRLYCVRRPLKYARSFFGVVDLLAIAPTYLSLFVPGTQYLLVIRVLRVLRVFRVLKMAQHLSEAQLLASALKASRRKIFVFLYAVFTMTVILGSMMYLIEGPENGFTSIPRGIYWAIVTLTTVGYGDIAPSTALGQALSALVMIMGYGMIAVPTGIVTVEMANLDKKDISTQACLACGAEGHDANAKYCKFCGEKL